MPSSCLLHAIFMPSSCLFHAFFTSSGLPGHGCRAILPFCPHCPFTWPVTQLCQTDHFLWAILALFTVHSRLGGDKGKWPLGQVNLEGVLKGISHELSGVALCSWEEASNTYQLPGFFKGTWGRELEGQERVLHLGLYGYSLYYRVLKHLGLLVFQLENILLFISFCYWNYQKGLFGVWWLWLSLLLSKFLITIADSHYRSFASEREHL